MVRNIMACYMLYFRSLNIVQQDIIVVLVIIQFFLFGHFLVGWFQYSSLECCWITLRVCVLLFIFVFWRSICDMQASLPLIPFQNFIVFSSTHCLSFGAHAFFDIGTICHFSWNGTYVSHWRFHDNRHMNISADVSKFQIVQFQVKCWILLKPVLGGVDGSLHWTVRSMNRLNQVEPATFSMLSCWAFLWIRIFSILNTK
jgi:hypothetical protein